MSGAWVRDGNGALRRETIAWPYLPGEKKISRVEALTLNRIAQLICGSGAAEVDYRGAKLGDIDALVAEVVAPPPTD